MTPTPENWNPFEQLADLLGAQSSGAESAPPEVFLVGTAAVHAGVIYTQQTICPEPKVPFCFSESSNVVFTEPDKFPDLASLRAQS